MRETAVNWVTGALNGFSRCRERQPVAFGRLSSTGQARATQTGLQVVQGYLTGTTVVILVAAATCIAGGSGKPDPIEYNRDVRPILSDRCYQCHGPDTARRKADLRLDDETSAKAPRDGGPAIVPGERDGSELYRRITAKDATERMPPAKSGKSLTSGEIEMLGRWIDQGAKWQPHWSFIPPVNPSVPQLGNRDRIKNPIDEYIQGRLETEGLKPSAEAVRGILIRA